MIERREFISICRQIGTMMEVGVDFLRITQALRSQTDNPRLIQLYDQLDEDLRAGDSLSDAMSHAPDVFSPFAVSLVRQGEARGDIEGAWARIADFYKVEAREDIELGDEAGVLEPLGARFQGNGAARAPLQGRRWAPTADLSGMVQKAVVPVLWGTALLLVALGGVRLLAATGAIAPRFESLAELGVAALFFAAAGAVGNWKNNRLEENGEACAFCGREASEDVLLSYAGDGKTAICSQCAGQITSGTPRTREQRAQDERERNEALLHVADALPTRENALLDDTIVLDADDPLAPDRNN